MNENSRGQISKRRGPSRSLQTMQGERKSQTSVRGLDIEDSEGVYSEEDLRQLNMFTYDHNKTNKHASICTVSQHSFYFENSCRQ